MLSEFADAVPGLLHGLRYTLMLVGAASGGALLIGAALGLARVSPYPSLKVPAATYVNVVRNIPAVVMFFFSVFILPQLGIRMSFYWLAVIALSTYFAVFVSDAILSGFNAVPVGQLEAARALGLSDGETMSRVVLPQAVRSVIPPLTVVLIQLVKVSAIAGAFGVPEIFMELGNEIHAHPSIVLVLLAAACLLYLVITIPMGRLALVLEKRVRLVR
ncbi:amino acid ABC transporter permease [Aeromicrobium sp. YIM 150415]|uniref:amino acid ABC transporter permease n=1 Tax=Aeromicrobium sp. YIM 150415 TaxID=2803912 RepID=UPI001963425B|nr:amino acid ABC transporter permease [Aeromicrobium sp. YIM 150415]MBM9463404.1 amino acid ABC transporter permease [Aeromicrobium sp. YIM 150415]